MAWDPELYHKFQAERFLPFEDLLGLIKVRPGMSVIDLGCGTGELTRRVADHLPESRVLGIDSSPQMLEKATAQARAGLTFELRPIQEVSGPYDLVFSHAAIQWVDDHERLIPRLLSLVKPGGQLAVQLPSNHKHVTQTLLEEIAAGEPFAAALNGWRKSFPVLEVERYAELLYAAGGRELTVFAKIYPHVLADADAIADWTSGTALVPYFERLSALKDEFLKRYRQRLKEVYPNTPVFFGFKRILFAATRAAAGL
ncbi:MAG TPA: methyltransferase domain-containing protein [Planctomycetota bacterium]|nr:methyltransferase domain-containing protein [Planctomycetota bacterium]